MLGSLAYIFGYLLKFWLNVVGNYGWALILFTVTIKAILFPLTLKQQKSTQKTQELQPKIQELQEKYKDDQQKMTEEYQKFMKENKFNPFGGCLLMILQLFVLIGVLYVVTNPMRYMDKLSDTEINEKLTKVLISDTYSGDSEEFNRFATKYIAENSGDKNVQKALEKASGDKVLAYTEYYKITNRYHELNILKNEYDLSFFGINLGDITIQDAGNIKLWVFPVLTTIFYYLSLWMVSKNQKKTTPKMKDENGNEIEMPNMMTMNITMPLLSGWISASVPQGMGLYWFTNSFLQVIIQLVTQKLVKKEKEEAKSNEDVVIEAENLENTDDREENEEGKKEKFVRNKNASKKKKRRK